MYFLQSDVVSIKIFWFQVDVLIILEQRKYLPTILEKNRAAIMAGIGFPFDQNVLTTSSLKP